MGPSGRNGARRGDPSGSQCPPVRAIGRYQVARILGEGAMGRVFLATDPELGREVAIKVLRLEAAGTARDAYIARFRNEARAAARFLHPNVVAVYDAGVDPTLGPYLVYEYVAGQTLRARLGGGRLTLQEAVIVARGIASALDALHAADIIHRDIKPDNVLLTPSGGVKVTDFGIARVPDAALTRDGQFLGTPAYAAPEAITRGEYSPRADVFSLAAVLYESLCGVRPFPGDDAVKVSYAVAHDTPLPPSRHVPSLPPGTDALFARSLSKRPAERFGTAGELAGALYNLTRVPAATAFVGATATVPMATAAIAPPAKRPQHPPPPPAAEPIAPPSPARAIYPALAVACMLTLCALAAVKYFARPAAPQPAPAPPPVAAPAPSRPARRSTAPSQTALRHRRTSHAPSRATARN